MVEGTDNIEDRLSCDDSSYGKYNLEVYDSGDGVNSKTEDEEYVGAIRTHWERSLTSYNLLEPIRRLCDSASCSYRHTQDVLDPLQLALVLIFS